MTITLPLGFCSDLRPFQAKNFRFNPKASENKKPGRSRVNFSIEWYIQFYFLGGNLFRSLICFVVRTNCYEFHSLIRCLSTVRTGVDMLIVFKSAFSTINIYKNKISFYWFAAPSLQVMFQRFSKVQRILKEYFYCSFCALFYIAIFLQGAYKLRQIFGFSHNSLYPEYIFMVKVYISSS